MVQLVPSSAMGQMIEFQVNGSSAPGYLAAAERGGPGVLAVCARSRSFAEL